MKVIKICGITTPEDAAFAARAGADRLGLIFAGGPRNVTLERAAEIASAVPGMALTGVFLGADLERIAEAVRAAALTHVQLHDCPDPADWDRIAEAVERPVIPALTAEQSRSITDSDPHRTVLLDLSKDPQLRTEEHRRQLQRAAAELAGRGRPVLIAGDLDPDNVRRIAHRTRCAGVDVARGVERSPGVKDPLLVQRFIREVRSLEYGHVH
jgi:phosphoribosylanthranilate isomerase